MMDRVQALLAESLLAWRVNGEVRRDADAVLVLANDQAICVARAAPGLPFRYTVTVRERARHASSVAGLLRIMRGLVDPAYQPNRLRIAPTPIVAS
jgi:hypothetical protein